MKSQTQLKKKFQKMQTGAVVGMYPFLMLLQHNNATTRDWSTLKQTLQREHSLQCFTVKNSVLRGVLALHHGIDSHHVCQGPTVVVGCHTVEQLHGVQDILLSTPKMVFVTCLSQTGLWTHLDLERLRQTSTTVWNTLVTNLERGAEFHATLQAGLDLLPLQTPLFNLVNVLALSQNLSEKSLEH